MNAEGTGRCLGYEFWRKGRCLGYEFWRHGEVFRL